jgi:hypothetical protein
MAQMQIQDSTPAQQPRDYARPTLQRGPVLADVTDAKGSNIGISDARLKHDIQALERLPNGLTLYRFRYNSGGPAMVGVMAQEVLRVMPEAVAIGADGYYRVDYARLGIRCVPFDVWGAERGLAAAA